MSWFVCTHKPSFNSYGGNAQLMSKGFGINLLLFHSVSQALGKLIGVKKVKEEESNHLPSIGDAASRSQINVFSVIQR